jgi:hypothetical protein
MAFGVVASGGPDCHLFSGCGFPAPGAEIFQFDAILSFTIGGLAFNISKVTLTSGVLYRERSCLLPLFSQFRSLSQ